MIGDLLLNSLNCPVTISSGISIAEIEWAAEIAAQVKKGAHIALKNCMNEIIGKEETHDLPCSKTENKSCCC